MQTKFGKVMATMTLMVASGAGVLASPDQQRACARGMRSAFALAGECWLCALGCSNNAMMQVAVSLLQRTCNKNCECDTAVKTSGAKLWCAGVSISSHGPVC